MAKLAACCSIFSLNVFNKHRNLTIFAIKERINGTEHRDPVQADL